LRKNTPWLLLLWLLAPLLIWWAVRDIRLGEILAALSRLGAAQILTLVGLNGVVILLMAGRWWLILRAQGYAIPYLSVAGYRLVSFGISYFTPGPQFGGEPAQVHYLRTRHAISTTTALASVSLDKILELLASFLFLLIGVSAALLAGLLVDLRPFQVVAWIAGPFVLLCAYTLSLWRGKTPLAGLLARLPQGNAGVRRMRLAILAAEGQIGEFCQQNPRAVAAASLFSLLTGAAMVLEYWVTLTFLGISVNLLQAIAVLTAALIAFLFPLPGGLGALEASQVLAMTALGFSPALGFSASLLIRARDVSLGALGLVWGGLLSRKGKRPQPYDERLRIEEETP
jgi:uncharacterized protein (TIRG00374 family)